MMAVRIEASLQFCCCFLQDFEGNRLIGEMLDGTEGSSLFFVIRMSDDGGGVEADYDEWVRKLVNCFGVVNTGFEWTLVRC